MRRGEREVRACWADALAAGAKPDAATVATVAVEALVSIGALRGDYATCVDAVETAIRLAGELGVLAAPQPDAPPCSEPAAGAAP